MMHSPAKLCHQNQARMGCPRSPQKMNQRPAVRTMSSWSAIAMGSDSLASPRRLLKLFLENNAALFLGFQFAHNLFHQLRLEPLHDPMHGLGDGVVIGSGLSCGCGGGIGCGQSSLPGC